MTYIKPECEILEFKKDDIITDSTPTSTPTMPFGAAEHTDSGDGHWY